MISQKELRAILDYCPDTGVFRWAVNMPPRGQAGSIAGFDNGSGYIKISIHGKKYYAHRLAFIWMLETEPNEVDHINHCRSDNRWQNLRAADRASNCSNVPGRNGVRKRYGRWYARRGRGAAHLGVFGTEAEAAAAHKAAEVSAAGLDPNSDLLQLPAELPKHDKRRYLFHGKSIAEWGRITGIPHPTLYWRMRVRNWPLELAIKANTTK